jgi:hypothetical protein
MGQAHPARAGHPEADRWPARRRGQARGAGADPHRWQASRGHPGTARGAVRARLAARGSRTVSPPRALDPTTPRNRPSRANPTQRRLGRGRSAAAADATAGQFGPVEGSRGLPANSGVLDPSRVSARLGNRLPGRVGTSGEQLTDAADTLPCSRAGFTVSMPWAAFGGTMEVRRPAQVVPPEAAGRQFRRVAPPRQEPGWDGSAVDTNSRRTGQPKVRRTT